MRKGISAGLELGAIGALFISATACTLSSLSKQAYDLVEVRFCPPSANGFNTKEQKELDAIYCSVPRYVLKEEWEMRGLFGSKIPEREDLQLKRFLPTDNPSQHWSLTGSAVCLAGISIAIATRNAILQSKYFDWLESIKTTNFEIWQDNKKTRDLKTVATAIDTRFKADIYGAIDNQNRVEAGLISTTELGIQIERQDNLNVSQYDLMIAELRKKIAEERLAEAKAIKEKDKLNTKESKSKDVDFTQDKLQLEDKYQWIYKLLKLPFRVLSGEQGSGKSTLERLMIKLLKDEGWHIVLINPETNPSVWSGIDVLADADEINDFFESFPGAIKERQQEARDLGIDEDDYLDHIKERKGLNGKVAIFLCETNTYEVQGVNPDFWAAFLKQSLTNIRKWGYTVCLTAHSDNQTSISSKLGGFSKNIDAAPRVECIAVAGENGEAKSSGKAKLKMKGLKDPEPLEVELYNYPKSKNFGTSQPKDRQKRKIKDSIIPQNYFNKKPKSSNHVESIQAWAEDYYQEMKELPSDVLIMEAIKILTGKTLVNQAELNYFKKEIKEILKTAK